MAAAVSRLGPSRYACIVHHGGSSSFQWNDDPALEPGDLANLVFVQDRVLADFFPALLGCASTLARGVVDLAERRLAAVDDLTRARDLKADAIDELRRERDVQAQAAAQRLQLIEKLTAELAELMKPQRRGLVASRRPRTSA